MKSFTLYLWDLDRLNMMCHLPGVFLGTTAKLLVIMPKQSVGVNGSDIKLAASC